MYAAVGRFVVWYVRTRYRRELRIGLFAALGLGAATAAAAAWLANRHLPEG